MHPVLQVQADFFTKRWLSVQRRFWGRSQWVLAVDTDVMAANLSASLDAFLDMPQDLVLTVRVSTLVKSRYLLRGIQV